MKRRLCGEIRKARIDKFKSAIDLLPLTLDAITNSDEALVIANSSKIHKWPQSFAQRYLPRNSKPDTSPQI
jgi:hypothetical protein